jgi:hypothetical protein
MTTSEESLSCSCKVYLQSALLQYFRTACSLSLTGYPPIQCLAPDSLRVELQPVQKGINFPEKNLVVHGVALELVTCDIAI